MEDKLKILLADIMRLNVEDITDHFSMEDSDLWDSLKHMELIARVEDDFGIQLSFDEIVKMTSYTSILDIIVEKSETE